MLVFSWFYTLIATFFPSTAGLLVLICGLVVRGESTDKWFWNFKGFDEKVAKDDESWGWSQ